MNSQRRYAATLGGALLLLLCTSATASAQSAISGLVRDATGAVLPGVTVEASSPVLIEKIRTVITDDQGRYTIVDLRPGTYTITFELAGFNALRREGVPCREISRPPSTPTCESARSRNLSP